MHTAEIISIGTELLSGGTVNTNAAFISARLKEIGFVVQRQTTIPDARDLIIETLAESLACASLVIATGGLGPTVDDLTRAAVADLMDSPMEFNETLAESLRAKFGDIDSLENQATQPKNAHLLPNLSGTAAGLIFIRGSSVLVILPGVPLEMESLMKNEVIPYLTKNFPLYSHKEKERLHFFNLYESSVDPLLRKLQERFTHLEIGIYPHHGLLSVNLEGDPREVLIARTEILKDFGENAYISSDGKIETAIQELFIRKNWTLSLAESCSGGALAARLTSISGSSAYFLGSIVAYSNELKEKFLNIPPALIQEKGAVSPETSVALATSVQQKTASSVSIGVTGIAGPTGGSQAKPVGTVYIAIKKNDQPPISLLLATHGERPFIIERTINFALGELYRFANE